MAANIIFTEDFAKLRQNSGYYVDKTGFLLQFLESPAEAMLFTRPRRFGKTLFLSMLASFFDITMDSRELFAWLKVAENPALCREWMNQYPVISLTMKDVDASTYAEAIEALQELISDVCTLCDEVLENKSIKAKDRTVFQQLMNEEASESTLHGALPVLTRALFQHYGKPVILLIDEYDVPVARAMERSYHDAMNVFMRNFLSDGLQANPCLQFGILAGALRSTGGSLDTLGCFGIASSSYSDCFGFTQGEVDQLLAVSGLESRRKEIREWYDGYRFGKQQEVYCPWSIMYCIDDLQTKPLLDLQPYWTGTSGNELPGDFGKCFPREEDIQGKIAALLGGNAIAAELNPNVTHADILKNADNFWSLLYLTGYLAPAPNPELYAEERGENDSLLVIPNRDVQTVFQAETEAWIANFLPRKRRNALYQALWAQDVQELEKELTAVLVSSSFHDAKEAYYHGMMFGIFAMRYGNTVSNGESGVGQYDIVVPDRANERAAVLEFKRASSEKLMGKKIEEALAQIATHDYDVRLRAEGYKTILHVGIAFCQKTAKVGFEEPTPCATCTCSQG